MALPLQPGLDPWPPRLKRLAFVLALAALVLVVGWFAPSRHGRIEPVPTTPGTEGTYERRVAETIRQAQRRVWVVMYSLWPGPEGKFTLLDELAAAVQRGVKVQVCLDIEGERNGKTPNDGNAVAAQWLAEHGIKVVRDEPDRRTHAKLILVDDRLVVLGSHNWTRSALRSNRELSVLTDDAGVATASAELCRGIPGWDKDW